MMNQISTYDGRYFRTNGYLSQSNTISVIPIKDTIDIFRQQYAEEKMYIHSNDMVRHRISVNTRASPIGIKNFGQSCFANVLIQSLYSLISYRIMMINKFSEHPLARIFQSMSKGFGVTYDMISKLYTVCKLPLGTPDDLMTMFNKLPSITKNKFRFHGKLVFKPYFTNKITLATYPNQLSPEPMVINSVQLSVTPVTKFAQWINNWLLDNNNSTLFYLNANQTTFPLNYNGQENYIWSTCQYNDLQLPQYLILDRIDTDNVINDIPLVFEWIGKKYVLQSACFYNGSHYTCLVLDSYSFSENCKFQYNYYNDYSMDVGNKIEVASLLLTDLITSSFSSPPDMCDVKLVKTLFYERLD
jgi:hypothetical protein